MQEKKPRFSYLILRPLAERQKGERLGNRTPSLKPLFSPFPSGASLGRKRQKSLPISPLALSRFPLLPTPILPEVMSGRPSQRFPEEMSRKSFVAADFLKEMSRNGFGRPDCIAISAALSGPGRGSRAVAVKPG